MHEDTIHGVHISIHAPREGCDFKANFQGDPEQISIHAPREGCDNGYLDGDTVNTWDFNPRTP